MSHNITISTYEQDYFLQHVIQKHAEFQNKYFYELQQNAQSWLDYWFFINRYLNYYVSVVSYYFFGIFTCPAHQFEEELKLNPYKQLKVLLKEGDDQQIRNLFDSYFHHEIFSIFHEAILEDNLPLIKYLLSKSLIPGLRDYHYSKDYAYLEQHIYVPEIHDYLAKQCKNFLETEHVQNKSLKAFLARIQIHLMSPYQKISHYLSLADLEHVTHLYQAFNADEKGLVWEDALQQNDVACMELLLSQQWQGEWKNNHFDSLAGHYLTSQPIRQYLQNQLQKIQLTPQHFQWFSALLAQQAYHPTFIEYEILLGMSAVASSQEAHLRQLGQIEHELMLSKKAALLSLSPQEICDAKSEWMFALRYILTLKKGESKNKEWDEELLNLSKNQSLVNALNEEEQQHLKACTTETTHKFRPLGGTVGPALKQWRKNSMFSKSTSAIDAHPQDEDSDEKKAISAQTLI